MHSNTGLRCRQIILFLKLIFFTMKRVFLFLVSALVCGTMMTTSCSKDEDHSVALTGLTVNPTSVKKPVGEIQKVTVTAVPENATGVTYKWTSANESIATVNEEGIVRIQGVGKTTVKVESGTLSATVDVEGTIKSITLKDEKGGISGTYPYNGESITFTLTATTDPAASVKPEWSTDAENVTVKASENGLSAQVTIDGIGAAAITATVGEVSGTYNISTTSIFDDAKGYWTFEDADLGKATKGTALTYTASQFSVVPGPSATKKAVRINHDNTTGSWRTAETYQGFVWNHGITGTSLQNYTVLIDARVPIDKLGDYYIVYSANEERDGGVAGVAFRSRSGGDYGDLTINHGGSTLIYYARWGTFTPGDEPWVRLVFSVIKEDPEGTAWKCKAVINGLIDQRDGDDKQYTVREGNDITNYELRENVPVRFLMAAGNNEDNHAYDVSTIAVWDRVLTDAEIASLGGVSK
jgi:hypothetical protein